MAIQDYVTGVQHVGIPTKDLAATIAFYEALGFEQTGLFPNGNSHCAFLKLGNLVIETWEGEPVGHAGAINHVSLDATDIEKAFAAAKAAGFELIDHDIQSIPTFWQHGIRYFNILGPNQEIIEFCEILAQ